MLGGCKLKKAGILDWVPPGAAGAITCVMAILRQHSRGRCLSQVHCILSDMELRFTPTEEDVCDLSRTSSTPGWYKFLFFLLLAVLFLVGAYLVDHGIAVAGWVWLGSSVAIGIGMYEVPRLQTRRAFRRSPSVQGETVYILNENGVTANFSTGRSQVEWRAFVKYQETASFFLLFFSPYRYWWIPKRAISPGQAAELYSLLKAHISPH